MLEVVKAQYEGKTVERRGIRGDTSWGLKQGGLAFNFGAIQYRVKAEPIEVYAVTGPVLGSYINGYALKAEAEEVARMYTGRQLRVRVFREVLEGES